MNVAIAGCAASTLKPPPERATTQVTPSPKPAQNNTSETMRTSTSLMPQQRDRTFSRVNPMSHARQQHRGDWEGRHTVASNRSNSAVRESGKKRTADQAQLATPACGHGTWAMPNCQTGEMGHHSYQSESGRSVRQAASNYSPKPTWRQAKREQQKAQQKAFRRKQDNPFRHFAHDVSTPVSIPVSPSCESSLSLLLSSVSAEQFRITA